MERPYHTIRKNYTQALVRFLTKNRQALLPILGLIEHFDQVLGRLDHRSAPSLPVPRASPCSTPSGCSWIHRTGLVFEPSGFLV